MITKEKLEHHIKHLQEQHAILDKQIDEAEQSGHFNDDELNNLKKKRLSIRDEIEHHKKQIEKLDGLA
jgi:hypothetical protein